MREGDLPSGRPLVVGFDLDMTLVDSSPGLAATLLALADDTGIEPFRDPELVDALISHNVDDEFALRFPAEHATRHADRFRELYVQHGVPGTTLLPGAQAAFAAVHAHGGAVLVLTAKFEPNARRCLDHVGLCADRIVGRHWGAKKIIPLREHGALLYVGDTVTDMQAARSASVTGVGVTTGPHTAADLRDAGAAVVLSSLDEFAAVLEEMLGR